MIEYIKGEIADLTPTYVVLDINGLGYGVQITLPTYTALTSQKEAKLYVHEAIREDAYVLYGFLSQQEREFFLCLLSVSGVGASTARIILSSLTTSELQDAILCGNVATLKSVKGIGGKTAERIIVDLKDKIAKLGVESGETTVGVSNNSVKSEVIAALVMLGFAQNASQKAAEKAIEQTPNASVAQLVKLALKLI